MLPEAGSLFDAVAKAAEKNDTLVDACQVPAAIEVVDGMTAYQAQKNLTLRINLAHIAAGVQIFAPESTFIAPDAVIEAGASILPGCLIRPGSKVGAGAVIGPTPFWSRRRSALAQALTILRFMNRLSARRRLLGFSHISVRAVRSAITRALVILSN